MSYVDNKGNTLVFYDNNDGTATMTLTNSDDVVIGSVVLTVPSYDWIAEPSSNSSIHNKPIIATEAEFAIQHIDYAFNGGKILNAMYFSMFERYSGGIDIVLDTDVVVRLSYANEYSRIQSGYAEYVNESFHDVSRANNKIRRVV